MKNDTTPPQVRDLHNLKILSVMRFALTESDTNMTGTCHGCSLGFRHWCEITTARTPRPIQYAGYDIATSSVIISAAFQFTIVTSDVVQPFGSVLCCRGDLIFPRCISSNFIRQASITHAEKFCDFSSSRAAAICSSILYEKRMFFVAVLLVFDFFGMATLRVVWCFVDNFRQGEVNVIDLYQYNLSELTQDDSVKKHLRTHNGLGYVNPAPHKSGVGRGNPCKLKATPDAASVFFVVCYMRHLMAWCVLFNVGSYSVITHNGTHRAALIMVTLAGQPQGWPVPFSAGISTPVNVTAPIERGNSGGDSLIKLKEAANMATTPTPSHPQIVILPYVSAVDPSGSEFRRMVCIIEQALLNRVKKALDEAGVAWFDPRTKEHSQLTTTSGEASDNA